MKWRAANCIRRKSGGGYEQICLSSSSRQNRRGRGTVGGGGQAMGAGPLVHGNTRGGGKNREEAEGVRFRPSPRAETVYGGLSMEMGGGLQW
jgi:hypothetical protein